MPSARPEIFWTGRVRASVTARTVVSTLSATSTALSVTRSTLSSCMFTRSIVPAAWLITGRTSRSSPWRNDESRPTVPPRRTSRYTSPSAISTKNTLSAIQRASIGSNSASGIAGLYSGGCRDQPGADHGVVLVEHGGLAGRDAVRRLVEQEAEAAAGWLDARGSGRRPVAKLGLGALNRDEEPPGADAHLEIGRAHV